MPNFWEVCTVTRFVNLSEPEVWIPLQHLVYADAYFEVSDQGRVRFVWKNDRHKEKYMEVVQFYNSAQKCMRVYFGGNVSHTVHSLVAGAFLENPNNNKMVTHLDGNKRNNKLTNLCWKAKTKDKNNLPETVIELLKSCETTCFRDRADCFCPLFWLSSKD